jgi:hypothetical protein
MTDQAISPLRRRMIEDMAIRKFAPKTQHDYVQRVKDFAAFLGRSPDLAQSEDVRGFRLHLASSGAGAPKINATVSALRFFFNVTLDRPELVKHLAFMHEPRKVPVVNRALLRGFPATYFPDFGLIQSSFRCLRRDGRGSAFPITTSRSRCS